MREGLSADQIGLVCQDLLRTHRQVTLRQARAALRERYGATGRSERVAQILKAAKRAPMPTTQAAAKLPPIPPDEATRRVLEAEEGRRAAEARAAEAERRASLAEQRADRAQDFWADRIMDKVEEARRQVASEYGIKLREADNRAYSLLRKIQDLTARLTGADDGQ